MSSTTTAMAMVAVMAPPQRGTGEMEGAEWLVWCLLAAFAAAAAIFIASLPTITAPTPDSSPEKDALLEESAKEKRE